MDGRTRKNGVTRIIHGPLGCCNPENRDASNYRAVRREGSTTGGRSGGCITEVSCLERSVSILRTCPSFKFDAGVLYVAGRTVKPGASRLPSSFASSLPINPARGSNAAGRFQGYCRRCMRRRWKEGRDDRAALDRRDRVRQALPPPSLRRLSACWQCWHKSLRHRCSLLPFPPLKISFFARRRDEIVVCEGAKKRRERGKGSYFAD